jgi:hypothetical protein
MSPTPENVALCASPIACAVADAWCADETMVGGDQWNVEIAPGLARALDALELATRESPLRKVKP